VASFRKGQQIETTSGYRGEVVRQSSRFIHYVANGASHPSMVPAWAVRAESEQ